MDILFRDFESFLRKNSTNDQDITHSNHILSLFKKQSFAHDYSLTIDCHNYKTADILWILRFITENIIHFTKIIFITGIGNHSKKPQMDYYCSTTWKNPMYNFILDYFVKRHYGGRIYTEHGKIILRL
jgi:hypothetical protein